MTPCARIGGFLITRCIECGRLSWVAVWHSTVGCPRQPGATADDVSVEPTCGGVLAPAHELQDGYDAAFKLGGWQAVWVLINEDDERGEAQSQAHG